MSGEPPLLPVRRVRLWVLMQSLRSLLWLNRRLATPERRAAMDAAGDDDDDGLKEGLAALRGGR